MIVERDKGVDIYKNKLRAISRKRSKIKKVEDVSFWELLSTCLTGFYILWPIYLFIIVSAFFIIYFVVIGLPLNIIFDIDIISEGTKASDFIGSILFPNGRILFWPLLPWNHFWITFCIINIISVIFKLGHDSEVKEFKEKTKAYNIEKNKIKKKLNEELMIIESEKAEKRIKFEKEQEAKGLVEYNHKWGTPEEVEKWKEIDSGLNNNFAHLTPYQFEEFIAELFRKMGYSAFKTKSTGDYGADVIAEKDGKRVLIEVKQYSKGNNVTPKEVQRTLGSLHYHKANKAVFVTTSDFTVRARDIENEAPIELWDKKTLHQMVRKYFVGIESE